MLKENKVVFITDVDTSNVEKKLKKLEKDHIKKVQDRFSNMTLSKGSSSKTTKGIFSYEVRQQESLNKLQKTNNEDKKKAVEIVRELNELMQQASGSEEKKKLSVRAWRKEVSALEAEYKKIAKSGGDTSKISEELVNAQRELNKAIADSKLTGFQKLINTFKRVGFYRLARRLFQVIEQGLSKGLQGLISFDNQTNKTMSSMSASMDKINASVAMILMPLIEIAEPIISSIANGMAVFANNISMASASMKGLSEYTKISEEYMKDLQAEANSTALAFDKFESLNAQSSPYERAKINDEDKETAKEYAGVIKSIQKLAYSLWEVIKAIGNAVKKIFITVEPYIDDITRVLVWAIDIVADFISGLAKIFGWISSIIQTKEQLGAILMVIGSIVSMLSLLSGNPIGIIKGILSGLTFFGTGIGISMFANGGIAERGDLFIANEAGPELVYSGQNNSSSIMNISQFKQAMVEAIYECADVFQQPDGSVALYLDGAQIARSKSFKNELNRTNAGLNLR